MSTSSSEHVFDPREFMGIRVGYSDLCGGITTWDDVHKELSNYTLAEVLDVLGRVSAVLKTARDDNRELQAQIATGLFRQRAGEWLDRLDRFAAANGNARVVMFEPLQVAALAKAALLLLPPEGGLRSTIDYAPLATALLRISDLIGPGEVKGFETEEGRREWAKFLFASAIFYRGGFDLHDLARFHLLFLQPHEDLSSHPDYLDLPRLVETVTGVPMRHLWLGLTALQARWIALDANKAASGPVFIDEQAFLSAEYHFSREGQDRIVSIASSDVSALQQVIRAEYRIDDFRPYDLVPLAEKPLVRIGHQLFCASVPLLLSKLSTGLYYVIANSQIGEDRNRFTRFLGAVFERYVEELFGRMLRSSNAVVVQGDALRDAAGLASRDRAKTPDLLVMQDGFALVIEAKARFFPRSVRAGESWDDLATKVKDIYSRGARQLESAIELCEQGVFARLGVEPKSMRAYIPLLVSLDESPLTPLVYDLVTPVRPAVGASKTVPLQVIGVGEIEALEVAVAAPDLNLLALLGYKAESGMKAESLRNVVLQDPRLRGCNKRNPVLFRVYQDAWRDAMQTLAIRKR